MRLIINADDLGISTQVNDAIYTLIQGGLVTSATMMPNAPALEEAAAGSFGHPRCSFGVHLNLSQFAPLQPHPAFAGILDEEGRFTKKVLNAPLGVGFLKAALAEWRAQVARIQAYGITISHLDSHDHVHVRRPELFPILKLIQREFGIRKVRISKNIYSPRSPLRSKGLFCQKCIFNYALRHFYHTVTTRGFTDFQSFLEAPLRERRRYSSVELSVHPGHPAPEFLAETAALQTPWRERLEFPIDLISYRNL
ncbi:MAG: carbohydrate deacetylase [Thermodesulfobacteriota bacterium]